MDLLEQCQLWLEEQNYLKIIEAIELIPQSSRSSDENLLLAQAYNSYGVECGDLGYIEKACETFASLRQHVQTTISFHRLYGDALFNKGDLARALDQYLDALRISKDDKSEQTQYLLDKAHDCIDQLSLLLGHDKQARGGFGQVCFETYKHKVKASWDNILKVSSKVKDIFEEAVAQKKVTGTYGDTSEVVPLFSNALLINKGFLITFHNDIGQVEVTFISQGNREELYELVYFVLQCPDELLNNNDWRFSIDKGPAQKPIYRNNLFTIKSVETKVAILPPTNDYSKQVRLKVWSPSVGLYLNDEVRGPIVYEAMHDLVQYALGQIAYLALVEDIICVSDEYELTSYEYDESIGVVTLDELFDKLNQAGYNASINAREYLKDCELKYEDDGLINDVQPMRADVSIGFSSIPSSINEYCTFRHETFATRLDDGVVPGFLAIEFDRYDEPIVPDECIELDEYTCDGEVETVTNDTMAEQLSAIEEVFKEYFCSGPFATVHCTGTATGRKYIYIDFICYDLNPDFIKQLKKFVSSVRYIKSAFYAPMCALIPPVFLTRASKKMKAQFNIRLEDYILGKDL